MSATAISNNDMVYLHWHSPGKIPDCLGFSVIRYEGLGKKGTPLPAMVGFKGDTPAGRKFKDTDVWPVQKYAWKDLFAKRGGTYWYEIVPMLGKPGNLKPDRARALRTNSVTLSSKRGNCSVFFNRGIISTQAIAGSLPKVRKSGLPNTAALKKAILDPKNPIRKRLVGDLEDGVLTLLKRASAEAKGECYCALYELSDPDLIKHLQGLGKKAHVVLSDAGEADATNQVARQGLHQLTLDVLDRMMGSGHIGHNKFVVYVQNGVPKAVLCGSTNWTPTGLCAQSNNAVIFESPALARDYFEYWKRLKADTAAAAGLAKNLQDSKLLRDPDKTQNPAHDLVDDAGKPSGAVRAWFAPNTKQKSVPRPNPATPPDLQEVFGLIEKAKQGVLFLAFIPGSPSIVSKLKEVYDKKTKAGNELFYVRGAATSPVPAQEFEVTLYHRTAKADATVRAVKDPPLAAKTSAGVSSVAGIFATFAKWEAEIYQVGHAVIHDKILVIDPFTDDSVVVTGSHNLGFKASYSNDENLVIIRKDRAVAEAYAAHVLDVYEHYRWRWNIQASIRKAFEKLKAANPNAKPGELWDKAVTQAGPAVIKSTWQNLASKDTWQDWYVEHRAQLAAEDNFWSSFGGVGLPDP